MLDNLFLKKEFFRFETMYAEGEGEWEESENIGGRGIIYMIGYLLLLESKKKSI